MVLISFIVALLFITASSTTPAAAKSAQVPAHLRIRRDDGITSHPAVKVNHSHEKANSANEASPPAANVETEWKSHPVKAISDEQSNGINPSTTTEEPPEASSSRRHVTRLPAAEPTLIEEDEEERFQIGKDGKIHAAFKDAADPGKTFAVNNKGSMVRKTDAEEDVDEPDEDDDKNILSGEGTNSIDEDEDESDKKISDTDAATSDDDDDDDNDDDDDDDGDDDNDDDDDEDKKENKESAEDEKTPVSTGEDVDAKVDTISDKDGKGTLKEKDDTTSDNDDRDAVSAILGNAEKGTVTDEDDTVSGFAVDDTGVDSDRQLNIDQLSTGQVQEPNDFDYDFVPPDDEETDARNIVPRDAEKNDLSGTYDMESQKQDTGETADETDILRQKRYSNTYQPKRLTFAQLIRRQQGKPKPTPAPPKRLLGSQLVRSKYSRYPIRRRRPFPRFFRKRKYSSTKLRPSPKRVKSYGKRVRPITPRPISKFAGFKQRGTKILSANNPFHVRPVTSPPKGPENLDYDFFGGNYNDPFKKRPKKTKKKVYQSYEWDPELYSQNKVQRTKRSLKIPESEVSGIGGDVDQDEPIYHHPHDKKTPYGPIAQYTQLKESGALERLSQDPEITVPWEEPKMIANCWLQTMLSTHYKFSPSCNQDGTFGPKQCYLQRCWCTHRDGSPQDTDPAKRFHFVISALTLVCTQNQVHET